MSKDNTQAAVSIEEAMKLLETVGTMSVEDFRKVKKVYEHLESTLTVQPNQDLYDNLIKDIKFVMNKYSGLTTASDMVEDLIIEYVNVTNAVQTTHIPDSGEKVEGKSIHDCVGGIRDIWNNMPSCTAFYMIELEIYHEIKLYHTHLQEQLEELRSKREEDIAVLIKRMRIMSEQLKEKDAKIAELEEHLRLVSKDLSED